VQEQVSVDARDGGGGQGRLGVGMVESCLLGVLRAQQSSDLEHGAFPRCLHCRQGHMVALQSGVYTTKMAATASWLGQGQ
jgi:hypothetical protein